MWFRLKGGLNVYHGGTKPEVVSAFVTFNRLHYTVLGSCSNRGNFKELNDLSFFIQMQLNAHPASKPPCTNNLILVLLYFTFYVLCFYSNLFF